ncbi:hypothetical protein MKW94_018281, partial [Papaver nudicaule]|nr:hypothetical protein [Papaver nudicaule]
DTSDDDSVVDDDYRIDEAGASTSRSRPIPRRSPRLLAQAQRRGKRLMKGVRHFLGKMDVKCIHCGALHFMEERLTKSSLKNPTFGTCCLEGKIKLPTLREPPEELKRLYEGGDELAKSFRRYIR